MERYFLDDSAKTALRGSDFPDRAAFAFRLRGSQMGCVCRDAAPKLNNLIVAYFNSLSEMDILMDRARRDGAGASMRWPK